MLSITLNPILVIIVVFLSMALHELMHAVTSYWLGDDTAYRMGRITLNPLRSVDPVLTLALPLLLILAHSPIVFGAAKPVQVNFYRLRFGEFGGALVGLAGPATNFVIAIVSAILLHIYQPLIGSGLFNVLYTVVVVNVGFAIFNLIPWPPLDGSRVLYAFAPGALQEIMHNIEQNFMASIIIFWIALYTFLWNPLVHIITNIVSRLVS